VGKSAAETAIQESVSAFIGILLFSRYSATAA
jgi:hypothetical protein